jgi:WD40 repeat protein
MEFFGDMIETTSPFGLRIWNVMAGTEAVLFHETDGCCCVTFAPDGLKIWLASAKETVSTMDSETGDILSLLSWKEWGPAGPGGSLTSAPAPTQSESTKRSSAIGVHRHDTYNKAFDELQASKVHKKAPNTMKECLDDFVQAAFSSDGLTVIFGIQDGLLYMVDKKNGQQMYALKLLAPLKPRPEL